MMFGPVVTAWLAAGRWPGGWALPFLLMVAAAFVGRNAAGLALRGQGGTAAAIWSAVAAAVVCLSFAALAVVGGFGGLVPVGAVAVALFGVHSLLSVRAGRKRLDRSTGGEILGVSGLTLAGPAACVVAGGRLDAAALALWLGPFLFYTGGVLRVRSRLAAVRPRGTFGSAERRRATRGSVAYHVLLAAAALGGASVAGGAWAWLAVMAFVPALARAFHLAATLSGAPPNLKAVGLSETALAVWFSVVFAAAIRMAPFSRGI